MVFTCDVCAQTFTRSENLDRHQRSRHETYRRRPFACDLCPSRFSRRDVCKRHIARCAKKLGTKRNSVQEDSPENAPEKLQQPLDNFNATEPAATEVINEHDNDAMLVSDPFLASDNHFSFDQTHIPGTHISEPNEQEIASITAAIEEATSGDLTNSFLEWSIVDNRQLSPRAAAAPVAAYFAHFHPFLPIIHKPSFSVSSSPKSLLSIMVAVGGLYSAQSSPSQDMVVVRLRSKQLWEDGNRELEQIVRKDSSSFHEPWMLQAWLLHIVYGCFYGDEDCTRKSKRMLQTLIDNVRSLGLFNQDLTFPPSSLWTVNIGSIATWNENFLSRTWADFASQEAVRTCIYALVFCDVHINSPCNARALISATESNWDLLPSTEAWEAASAEQWFEQLQSEIEQGLLSMPSNAPDYRGQSTDRQTLLRTTQSLLSGKPTTTLLKRLSRSPFAILCVIANLDCLIRDFTRCLYQMPPGLPDPSAFHVLSQHQNRSMNSALASLLKLATEGSSASPNLIAFIQLSCWVARLGLCEPDDLLVSGIADNTITAGLATSAHLILGSHVANRRATASTPRKFGDDSSMTVWDDLLKCLAVVFRASRDRTSQEPPWITVTSYRALLILWRTLRRAVTELSNQGDMTAETAHYFNPAKIMVSIVCERARRFMDEEDLAYASQWEDLPGIEINYITLMMTIFSKRNASPVSQAIEDIMQEVIILMSPDER